MIITISSTYECIIVLIDLKQLLTHNNQKQKDKSSHLGFGFFFLIGEWCLISCLITVIEQSRSFWRSCQSRNPVRPSVHRSDRSRSLRKEPRTGGFTPKQSTEKRQYFRFWIFWLFLTKMITYVKRCKFYVI